MSDLDDARDGCMDALRELMQELLDMSAEVARVGATVPGAVPETAPAAGGRPVHDVTTVPMSGHPGRDKIRREAATKISVTFEGPVETWELLGYCDAIGDALGQGNVETASRVLQSLRTILEGSSGITREE